LPQQCSPAVAASRVDAVVLFFGFDPRAVALLREARILVLHQVGTVEEARRALADGADALIAQGIEAGGHLLGMEPALAFLRRALECADEKPVFLAGGVSGAANVRAAIAAGAAGVACGSRFLLTEKCRAHPAYKQRLLGADGTIVTELFGFGWPARHRVVPNAATERWCRRAAAGPSLVRRLNRATGFLGKLVPILQRDGFAGGEGPRRGDDGQSLDHVLAGASAGQLGSTGASLVATSDKKDYVNSARAAGAALVSLEAAALRTGSRRPARTLRNSSPGSDRLRRASPAPWPTA
jgi:NAD(P)H-dependent flavin oxidoreductase YrpB (nitropropane dioxygenase family)